MQSDCLHIRNQTVIHAFETDGVELENVRHMIAGAIYVRIAEYEERTSRRAVNETQCCLENDDAGTFRADQGARNVKSIFRQ